MLILKIKGIKMFKLKPNSEHIEQAQVCKYLEFLKIDFFSVPNGFFLKDRSTFFQIIIKMKQEGLKKGVPDLVVLFPHKILFLEMKTTKGTLSKYQKNWFNIIKNYKYASVECAKGFEEAKKIIDKELQQCTKKQGF